VPTRTFRLVEPMKEEEVVCAIYRPTDIGGMASWEPKIA
jgi:hypothetical protein